MKAGGVDLAHLDRALALAERGRYGTPPNPMVGAVIVRRGRVVAEAYHRRAGGDHAEIAALRAAGSRARGADLYLTLEPCVHQGRTPPCAPRVAASGIRRVVVAATDPNPLVSGRGVRALRRAGVEVTLAPPAWRDRAAEQNAKFREFMENGRPLVLAKWAATLDGRIASARGESRWITGEAARRRALLLREEYDAVLVGAGTVRADDPRLTRRLGKARGRPHWRIVLDGRLRLPETARVLRGPGERVVATALPETHPKARRLAARGIRVWSVPATRPRASGGGVDLARLLQVLARHGVTSLMVEGGGGTLGAFFHAGLVNRVAVFLAPRILGGARARGAVEGAGFRLADTPRLSGLRVERVGEDLLVTARVQ
ncbi:MAG TPA: bifunctional diaminohydroxyphosphoribosylaminopyrimidine deaminase/5-amino-6-(5-phosphoribosylamino)uracil reductase RibD [Thermoanaerobaculia bacterium]